MRNGMECSGPRAFGEADNIGVERGLAEFQAGRPVLIQAAAEAVLAMPVDGSGRDRVAAFAGLIHPAPRRLVITARRARVLGLDATQPVVVELAADDDAASVFALAANDR